MIGTAPPKLVITSETFATYDAADESMRADGCVLTATSPSGSRYYKRPDGSTVRVSDHEPTDATHEWLERQLQWFGQVADIRIVIAPGLYPGMPDAEYRAASGVNQSLLKVAIRQSLAHARHEQLHPKLATAAMERGSATHMALYEPERLEEVYTVAGQCCAIKGNGDRCTNPGKVRVDGRWYCGQHRPKGLEPDDIRPLSQDDYDSAVGVRDALLAHPRYRKLIKGVEHRECAFFWDQPLSNGNTLRCKGKLDELLVEVQPWGRFVLDLKTTGFSAQPKAMAKYALDRGLFVQAAHYMEGLARLGIGVDHWIVLAVEQAPPHGVRLYQLDQDHLAGVRAELFEMYEQWHTAEQTGVWPGYTTDFETLQLPAWAALRDTSD